MKKSILSCFLFLAACGQMGPYIDAHREAGQIQLVGQSTPDRVAVCYNPLWTNKDKIEELAVQECHKTNRKPIYSETKWFSCCLITPSTAFYDCQKD